ncbi:MAG: malonate--CoA ligase [Gammaproteobacteria bacterium]
MNIYSLFRDRFPEPDDAVFIETTAGQTFTYGDLDEQTSRLADYLASLGLQAGDRVAAQVDKSPYVLFVYLACVRAGLIYLPLNPAYQPRELDYLFGDAHPRIVVCSTARRDIVAGIADRHGIEQVFTLEADGGGSLFASCSDMSTVQAVVARDASDIAALVYTSGTTGQPKGAMITHGNLAANGQTLHRAWGWSPNDVLLHALPLFHVHGLFVACHCVLLSGARMIFLEKPDTNAIVDHLPRATVLMGVPTHYTRLLDNPRLDSSVCSGVRLFISGSAPLLEPTFTAFEQRTGHTILERYGMTETGMNLSNPLHGPRIAGTVGSPLPGVSARIVDDAGNAVQAGQVGSLEIKGPNVFSGYWRKPHKTLEDFTKDKYFITGDLARENKNGYISIVGRNTDMIISGGYNVYPKEVEQCIDMLDGVRESAVIGVPDADFGEAVTAVVVAQRNTSVNSAAVIARLKNELANYKVPKQVYVVEELPRNAMGKVQKNVLRERYG